MPSTQENWIIGNESFRLCVSSYSNDMHIYMYIWYVNNVFFFFCFSWNIQQYDAFYKHSINANKEMCEWIKLIWWLKKRCTSPTGNLVMLTSVLFFVIDKKKRNKISFGEFCIKNITSSMHIYIYKSFAFN